MVDNLVGIGEVVKGILGGGGCCARGRLVPKEISISFKFSKLDVYVATLVEPEHSATMIFTTV